jgi:hypothetical protein
MRTSIVLVVGIVAIVVIEFFAFEPLNPGGDNEEVSYASYADALKDGAVKRGWVHDFVPSSAVDIRESHNLDTNEQWLTFRFDAADRLKMQEKLKPLTMSGLSFPQNQSTHKRPWWPGDLQAPSDTLPKKYDLFSCQYTISSGGGSETCTAFVAIEKGRPRAWCWALR